MSRERGRSDIERLLADGELERVTPSDEITTRLLTDAEAHIRLASRGVSDDPAGALQLSYDAARKASAALLAVQGLRATTRGGHIAVIDAVRAQFNDRGGMEVFGRSAGCGGDGTPPSTRTPIHPPSPSKKPNARWRRPARQSTRAKGLIDSGRLEPFE